MPIVNVELMLVSAPITSFLAIAIGKGMVFPAEQYYDLDNGLRGRVARRLNRVSARSDDLRWHAQRQGLVPLHAHQRYQVIPRHAQRRLARLGVRRFRLRR